MYMYIITLDSTANNSSVILNIHIHVLLYLHGQYYITQLTIPFNKVAAQNHREKLSNLER